MLLPSPTYAQDGMGSVSAGGMVQNGSSASGPGPSTLQKPPAAGTANDLSSQEQLQVYQRANENLVMQTVYIQENMDSVKKLRDRLDSTQSSPPATYDDDVKAEMESVTSSYCRDKNGQTTGGDITDADSAIACLDQYREIRASQLREIRQDHVLNSDAMAKLHDPDKKRVGAPIVQANIKSHVFPQVPTYMDLSAEYKHSRNDPYPSAKVQQDEARALAKRLETPPDPSHYVKTEEVLLDPKNPNAGRYRQIVLGKDGKPLLDDKAYQKAKTRFDKRMKDPSHIAKGANFQDNVASRILAAREANLKKRKGSESLDLQTLNLQSVNLKSKVVRENIPGGCGDLSGTRADYCRARGTVVSVFNGDDKNPAQAQPKPTPSTLSVSTVVNPQAMQAQSAQGKAYGRGKNDLEPAPHRSLAGMDPTREDYRLRAGQNDNTDSNLYMAPEYIDNVIDGQFPQ